MRTFVSRSQWIIELSSIASVVLGGHEHDCAHMFVTCATRALRVSEDKMDRAVDTAPIILFLLLLLNIAHCLKKADHV